MYYTLHCAYFQFFRASEPHIILFKVRFVVALKEEAKGQVICERL